MANKKKMPGSNFSAKYLLPQELTPVNIMTRLTI